MLKKHDFETNDHQTHTCAALTLHEESPAEELFPAGQAMQELSESAASVAEAVPFGQLTQSLKEVRPSKVE